MAVYDRLGASNAAYGGIHRRAAVKEGVMTDSGYTNSTMTPRPDCPLCGERTRAVLGQRSASFEAVSIAGAEIGPLVRHSGWVVVRCPESHLWAYEERADQFKLTPVERYWMSRYDCPTERREAA